MPPREILEALDARVAMNVIGDQREYLLYKAANSLDVLKDGSQNDSLQTMLGLMLGKGLLGVDYHAKEGKPPSVPAITAADRCGKCGHSLAQKGKFCPECGAPR